jgi:hypothetical protein
MSAGINAVTLGEGFSSREQVFIKVHLDPCHSLTLLLSTLGVME